MKNLSEEAGYLKGLRDGMKLDDSAVAKLLNRTIDLCGELAKRLESLEESHFELSDYVDEIDSDLYKLECDMDMEEPFDEFDDDAEPFKIVDEDSDWDEDEDGVSENDHADIYEFPKSNVDLQNEADEESETDADTDEDDDEDDFEDLADEDDSDADDFFESLYSGCLCPECERMFCVKDPDFENEDRLYRCPYCGNKVNLIPIEKGDIPIAQPVDGEE